MFKNYLILVKTLTLFSLLFFRQEPDHTAEAILNLLIAHNADVNITALSGLTPLHIAAWHGQMGLAQVLIDAGIMYCKATSLFVRVE